MRWVLKAALQKVMSALPRGERLNYLFQRHVTHGLPRPPAEVAQKFTMALAHHRNALEFGRLGGRVDSAYEFGAGWDLIVAAGLYMLGVERQVLVDIRPLAEMELVNHGLAMLRGMHRRCEAQAGRALRRLPHHYLRDARELERDLGIRYLAPADARATGLPKKSFDLIHSTQTLEHIPENALRPIFRECRRLLSPGGVASLKVDMQDHYSYFDKSVSVYNYLTLSEGAWNLVNSGLHFQNRLRLPDYGRALAAAGLAVVHREVRWPGEADLELIRRLDLAARFRRRYTPRQLGARNAVFVCRPEPEQRP